MTQRRRELPALVVVRFGYKVIVSDPASAGESNYEPFDAWRKKTAPLATNDITLGQVESREI
jgi:hypothetical protein